MAAIIAVDVVAAVNVAVVAAVVVVVVVHILHEACLSSALLLTSMRLTS